MPVFDQINNTQSKDFEAIFFYASLGILIIDEKGKIVAVNPFALKEFGYTEKELVGEKIEILVPVHLRKKHSQLHKKYFEEPVTRSMNAGLIVSVLKKDGTEIPVEIRLSNYKKDGHKYVIAFINNISERKKSEAEIIELKAELEAKVIQRTADLNKTMYQLELSKDKLEESRSLQQALFDNAGAMIIATDEKGVIKFFNPEASRSLGYTSSELINMQTPVLFHDKNEIARKRKELFKDLAVTINDDFDVLVEKSKRNIHSEEKYTYIKKDKTLLPVLLTVTAIRDKNKKITGFMGVAVDISEQKKAEEKLVESLHKEKELGELKSRFVSMASHEFRTPLSTVLSSAYLIEKYAGVEDQPKREKHLQRIISSVNMLTDILNDFLSVGKIEEGKLQAKPTWFNIRDLITATAAEMELSLKKNQKIHYHHEGKTEIFLDANLLKHIVMNLVSNAIKFSPEASPIEINTTTHNQQVRLSIKDHGIGIAKEDQRHLMERFFRGANAGNIQGTGLGLYIVSNYTNLMNGTLKFISELEKGTEFIIAFNTKSE